MRSRLSVVFVLGLLWVLLIGARLYQLQVLRYDVYAAKAVRQQQRVITLDSPRGTIYDAHGRELAVSVQVDSAYAIPAEIRQPTATARSLVAVIPELDVNRLVRQLSGDREFVWVARKLDPPIARALHKLDLPGIHFLAESKRYYPMKELASQILGYVGTDNHGLAGLELVYDRVVTGKSGTRTVLRDARRGIVVSTAGTAGEPQPGRDLHLTLDAVVQHIVERELKKAVEAHRAKQGTAVFLDPQTGAVLAMASYPGFDPNAFSAYPALQWKNRAVADVFEPGSTFKIVTAAAALGSGLVRSDDVFDCEMGGITLLGHLIRDHKRYGLLSFADVIAKSSNVGVIKAALRIGGERLYGTILALGFGQPTGVDLPGESAGIVHPLEHWRPLDKAYIAFGQGVSVTALQLTAAVAAVANDGVLLRPYVVAATGCRGRIERLHEAPPVVRQAITPATAAEVKRLLERVVTVGTGRDAAVAGYRVAGKTGTAQIPLGGVYARHAYLPSFVGFAPSDRPAVVGIVAVDEPQGEAYYGAQVAAPVWSAVARQILLYEGIRPERERPVYWPGEYVLASLKGKAKPPALVAPPPAADSDDAATEDRIDDEPPPRAVQAAASAPVAKPAIAVRPAAGKVPSAAWPTPSRAPQLVQAAMVQAATKPANPAIEIHRSRPPAPAAPPVPEGVHAPL